MSLLFLIPSECFLVVVLHRFRFTGSIWYSINRKEVEGVTALVRMVVETVT